MIPATTLPEAIQAFWNDFARQHGNGVHARFYESFCFCDNEADADALAALVLAGTKRATAGLAWSNEHHGTPMPTPGALSVVTTWAGAPVCVIETTAVELLPFDQVSSEFAAAEGEGDGSLAYWRDAHWRYFCRECERLQRTPTPQMPVVCERFEVVYPVRSGVTPAA
ncbi:ASCH domain-containing protein [Ideonella sp. BN130291]|uniref:ASCH domain-containing protein n=1 Tax=Ideonella sp. BN130291 TaxID=3112940 RepID=UPI002E2545F4|nr:ASCH domain-containing protein [Ideonella sp. BN130291]